MFIFVSGVSTTATPRINKMVDSRVVVCLSLILLVGFVPSAAGKPRGTGCPPKNCKWANWERWTECDKACGSKGVQVRHRFQNVTQSCGGTACDGSAEESRLCNRMCYNGGKLSGGSCRCKKPYFGECCEKHIILKRDTNTTCKFSLVMLT